jgi:hypothetical protein
MNTLLSGERMRTNPAKKVGHFPNFVQKSNEEQTARQVRYNEYLLSPEWRELKRMVRARCLNVCEVCGIASVEATHHLTYERFGRERLSDLLGVCDKCHEKIHNIKNDHLIPLVFGG